MKIKFAINFSLWIGLTSGIYVFLYLHSPLASAGVLACTFVALPIYLNGGAKGVEMIDYCTSAIVGVLWGLVFIYSTKFLDNMGGEATFSASFIVFLVTAALCAIHFLCGPMKYLTRIPIMFGAVASTFFAGPDKWLYLMITLCLGVVLGYVNSYGTRLLDPDGRWILFRAKQKQVS